MYSVNTINTLRSMGGIPNSGATSSAGILYNQGGTGAVNRTVQSKFQETVSILDFGADPTGVVDCVAAFMLGVQSNRTLLVPPGTYYLNTTVPPPFDYFDNTCLLMENLTNFHVRAEGATFNVGDSIAFSGIFHFNNCTNVSWVGGTFNGNKFGSIPSNENTCMALTSVVGFYAANIWIKSGFGGIGAGLVGDWIVNAIFENIRMDNIGIATDVAFLKNVVFKDIIATGADFNGVNTGDKGFSIIWDGPNSARNATGISFTQSQDVSYIGCSASNFNTGATLWTGTRISYIGCDFSYNIGIAASVPGIGAGITYVNGGLFTSVGNPPSNISYSGCRFVGNGNATQGLSSGIILDASASAGTEKIDSITITGCIFTDNIARGIGAGAGGNSNLTNIISAGCTFSGTTQTETIAANIINVITALNTTGTRYLTDVQYTNNRTLYWGDNVGVQQPIMGINPSNELFIRPSSSAALIRLQNYSGSDILQINGSNATFVQQVNHTNNKNLYWADSTGTQQPIIGVNASNETFFRPGSAISTIQFQNYAGTNMIQATNDATNPVNLFVNGVLKNVVVGDADSGGTGFRYLRVAN